MSNLPPNPNNPAPRHGEFITSLRFSLANENIGSNDIIIHHPAGKWRAIEYPTPEPEQLIIRQHLYDKGLILGNCLTEDDEPMQAFSIPKSARPIAYEASSSGGGDFTYNDPRLYEDLGRLMGFGTRVIQHKYIIRGDLGRAVALIDFTRDYQRRLLFIPGIEQLLRPTLINEDILKFYKERVNRQFGYRFAGASDLFAKGYKESSL